MFIESFLKLNHDSIMELPMLILYTKYFTILKKHMNIKDFAVINGCIKFSIDGHIYIDNVQGLFEIPESPMINNARRIIIVNLPKYTRITQLKIKYYYERLFKNILFIILLENFNVIIPTLQSLSVIIYN